MGKLDYRQRHILKIIKRDAGVDGWVEVSEILYPVLLDVMPKELVILERVNSGRDVNGNGYRAKLTDEGSSVAAAMEWI